MPTLIACLSSGKGSWTEVMKLIKARPWDRIFLVTNQFGQENFSLRQDNLRLILVDTLKETEEIAEHIKSQLQGQIKDLEIALNLASGTGKEHMAVLKAVMESGLNFRLITLRDNQMEIF